MQASTFSPSAFLCFPFSHRPSTPHVPTLTRFSALTSVALRPVTPVTCAVQGQAPALPPILAGASDRRGCAWPLLTAFSEGTSSCRCSATLFISRRERGRDGIWNSICLGTDVCLGPRVVSPRGLTLSSSSSSPHPPQPLLPLGRRSAATEQDRAGPAHTPRPRAT